MTVLLHSLHIFAANNHSVMGCAQRAQKNLFDETVVDRVLRALVCSSYEAKYDGYFRVCGEHTTVSQMVDFCSVDKPVHVGFLNML